MAVADGRTHDGNGYVVLSRWYSPALAAMMKAAVYMCRPCRYGHDWNNRRAA